MSIFNSAANAASSAKSGLLGTLLGSNAGRIGLGAGIGGIAGYAGSEEGSSTDTFGDTMKGVGIGALAGGALGIGKGLARGLVDLGGRSMEKEAATKLMGGGLAKGEINSLLSSNSLRMRAAGVSRAERKALLGPANQQLHSSGLSAADASVAAKSYSGLHSSGSKAWSGVKNNKALLGGMAVGGLAGAGLAYSAFGDNGRVGPMAEIASNQDISSTGYGAGEGAYTQQDSRQMFMDSTSGLVQGLHRGRH